MVYDTVRKRLEQIEISSSVIECIAEYIALNERAFNFSNIPIENLEIIVVFKNTGGYKIYKRIKRTIIYDKLDTSYIESRELVCISGWNIKKIYRFKFSQSEGVEIETLTDKEMRNTLFSVVDPSNLVYAISTEGDGYQTTITVDTSPLKGLTYKKLKECVDASFYHQLKTEEKPKDNPKMKYVLVDFT